MGQINIAADELEVLRAERDRLADAIDDIPRHEPLTTRGFVTVAICDECGADWPCPTEHAHIAAAATHQGNPSSVGSGCDGDHGAATADPATAGASSEGAAPKDTTTATTCVWCSGALYAPPFTIADGQAWHSDCFAAHKETP